MAKGLIPVVSREAMRELDRVTIARGTPSIELMERAGAKVADVAVEEARAVWPEDQGAPRALVLAGPGNNGGDGFVAARLLATRGWEVSVALCAREPAPDSDPGVNLKRWRDLGGDVIDARSCLERLAAADRGNVLVIDALFGTGLVRPLEGDYHDLVAALNDSGLPVVAVDMPSGLCADTGMPLGVAVFARATVTLGAAKPGLFCGVGPNHAGRIVVADIGLLEPEEAGIEPLGHVLDAPACSGWLLRRHRMTHKGELGHVLVVGGALGKSGAVMLAARAALRAGAGLVTMAVPDPIAAAVDAALIEAMTLALPATSDGEMAPQSWRRLAEEVQRFDAAVVGPGIGTGRGARGLLEGVLGTFAGPVVVDADGLNLLAADREHSGQLLAKRARQGLGPVILTPHPGEMGRLLGCTSAAVQQDRLGALRTLCSQWPVTVVLKGAGSLVGQGRRVGFNISGNPGMATAGMGDVLSGLAAALAAQRGDPFEAAAAATFLHGLAGDVLERRWGGAGFLAAELADAIPAAIHEVLRAGPR